MTFLSPALWFLGLAVTVPLVLHLLQRHQGPRVVFPALRYLKRAERENATRIRLRQVLLLALRVLAILLLAAAAARPFVRGAGADHEPTSVVLILDNSLSSGAVVADRRLLDELKDAALVAVAEAGPDDRFWLIRAGAPWEPAVTGDVATVAESVRRTQPEAGAADLGTELDRAASILASEPEGRAREIHLLTDLQASGLRAVGASPGAPPVAVLEPRLEPPPNRAITAVEIGGGLPPRAGERSTVAAEVAATGDVADTVTVRLVLNESVRGAAAVPAGAGAVLPFPPRPPGRVTGHVELDADAQTGDDRRWFVTEVAPPPSVAVGEPLPFLEEAVDVLEEAGRVRRAPIGAADVVLAPGARGAEAVRAGRAVVVLPPGSPLELAATNQRLATAGIPWRLGAPAAGEARLDAPPGELDEVLAEVRLREVYRLEPQGTPRDSVVLRLRDGEPWAVRGVLPDGGHYAILATPLTPEAGTIPTSAAMVPLLDRALSVWVAPGSDRAEYEPGDVITLPPAEWVLAPHGADAVTEGAVYRFREPGLYHVIRGGDTIAAYAVNPSGAESDAARLTVADVRDRLPGREVRSAGPDGWADIVYHRRLGREIVIPLAALALLILLLESVLAAAGRRARREPIATPAPELRPPVRPRAEGTG